MRSLGVLFRKFFLRLSTQSRGILTREREGGIRTGFLTIERSRQLFFSHRLRKGSARTFARAKIPPAPIWLGGGIFTIGKKFASVTLQSLSKLESQATIDIFFLI